jgi:hypothetical protein
MRPIRSLLAAVALGSLVGATALVALAEPPKGGFAPDPPPRASRKQWTIQVAAKNGKIAAERATSATLKAPVETPRVFGRFAVELYVGKELLDRARFNIPLMGDEPPQGNRNRLPRPRFDQNVSARVRVRIADHDRATYMLLVDRDSGAIQKLAWPPEADGKLVPWTSGVTEAKPGDFPDASVRVVGRDGGAADATPPSRGNTKDAGHD